jgi:CHAT domain-containing protein/tetratricopeptide (TPR) repeat protein
VRDTRSEPRAVLLLLLALGSACAAHGSQICGARVDSGTALAQAQRLAEQGEREGAASCYRRALAALPANDRASGVDARSGLARLAEERGAFEEARAQLRSALSEAEADRGPDAERSADVLEQLGWVEYRLGHYPDAERDLTRARLIYERVLGPYPTKVTQVLNKLGAVYREQGDYDRSESVLAQALANLDRVGADDRPLRAEVYNNLAGVAYYRNDYRRAIELYRSAASLFEELYGESRIEVARVANNLGLVHYEVGEYELARSELERALRLKTRLQGARSAAVGGTLSNLGELEAARGDKDRALSYFVRAEKVLSQSLGRDHPQVATVLLNQGITLAEGGDAAGARPLLERALAIRARAFGADSKHVAEMLNALVPVWSALGKHRQAADAARRALAIAATAGEQELAWNAHRAYALILAKGGHLSAAVFYGKQAVNMLQAMRVSLAPLGRRVPGSFLLRRESAYRELADALITLGRLTEAEQVIAMLKQEEFFGFTGLASMSDGSPVRASFSADEAGQGGRLDAAVLALRASARQDHAGSAERPGEPPNAAAYRRERDKYDAVVRSVDRALERATRRPPPSPPSLPANAVVDANTAVLTYLLAPDRVRLIVQMGGGLETYSLPVSPVALNRLVFDFRQTLQNPGSDPLPRALELHRVLLQPVQPRLADSGVEALELVLDGALRYLPYGALHDGHGFVVERFRVGLRTSLDLIRPANVAPEQERLAGFGVTRAVGGFPALTRVRNELDNIVYSERADSHGFIRGVVALDEAFTTERLSRTLDDRYPLVHIASHFVVRPGRLSESYLLLGDGSRLTLEQMKGGVLSFRDVRLLTLSACSTAVGEPDATGAEFESFSVLAGRLGAHQVLATLWSVADNSASALMTSFYRLRQQGHETVSALTEAQRTMLNAGGRHGPYSHPYYWAPFVVFLNDRPP